MLLGVRDDCIAGIEELAKKMALLKEIGSDFVELVVNPEMLASLTGSENADSYSPKKALRELNQAVAKTGLPILSVSYSNMGEYASKSEDERKAARRELRQCIELASAVGAGTILIATCETEAEFTTAAKLYKTELQSELDFALDRNIRLCFEPVWRTKNAHVAMLVQAINHPAAYIYYDMGNCLYFGEDPIEALHNCIDYVGAIHIKPKPGGGVDFDEMPLVGILNILKNSDFDGVGVLEIEGIDDNRNLAKALELLDSLGYRGCMCC